MCSSTSTINKLFPLPWCFFNSSTTYPTLSHTCELMYAHAHVHTHAQAHRHLAGSFHPSSSLYQAGLPRFPRAGSTPLILSLSLKSFPQLSIDAPYVSRLGECLDARFWRASLPGFKYWLCHLLPAGSWANALTFCLSFVIWKMKTTTLSSPPPRPRTVG